MSKQNIEVGAVFSMGVLYGAVAVQVVRASDRTVEYKIVGKAGTQIMSREIFAHKVGK